MEEGLITAPLAGFLTLPALRKPAVVWKECGAVDQFVIGMMHFTTLKPLQQRQWPEDWGDEAAWVFRRSEQDFVIYNIHCTHLGCPVNWSPSARRFFSPCHGGVFDEQGRVLAGPPPRPLDRYQAKIENGVLYAGPVYKVNDRPVRIT